MLRRLEPEEVSWGPRVAVDAETLAQAAIIVEDVRKRGEQGLTDQAVRLGEIGADDDPWLERPRLDSALASLPPADRALLERTAARIQSFAEAQMRCLTALTTSIPGGEAGHTIEPVGRAGCYAPGGRFPLPSSVLMTGVTARVAGVKSIWVASPRPTEMTLAAAALVGAEGFIPCGGAQAIAAMAYGAAPMIPACDAVVGPGNRWVTAGKQLVAGRVAIDMLAGPTELVILADDSADPALVAADLLAQAEHDVVALPMLVTTHEPLVAAVEADLLHQLESLPTAPTAREALGHGFCVVAPSLDAAISVVDRIAPEHLHLKLRDAAAIAPRLHNFGTVFIGDKSAEVFGDYGAGPNHVLPTGGTARYTGGLSVLTFLRVRTWLRIDDLAAASALAHDAAALARHEGLEAHARAAERRLR
jgi:phosphoribosyl-ATP pyrophosphohydrolase/phosphoribosyl-AMP cyclohydrolase/histidinol dehydrogenase